MDAARSRRQFLADTALGIAATSLAGCFPDVGGHWPEERGDCSEGLPLEPLSSSAPVVEVFDAAAVVEDAGGQAHLDPPAIAGMVRRALVTLAGSEEPWRELLPEYASGMRVGIKVNCLNQACSTSVPLVRALVDGLKAELRVPAADIVVWDRRLDELTRSGFHDEAVGARVLGTVTSMTDPSGPGYEDAICRVTNGKITRLSRILTEHTDVTVNCPVLKTHDVSGVTAAMKNIYGIIDNPGDFHDDLVTALPALYALAPVRGRMRLQVVDALIAVTTGGTSSPPDLVPRRILAGADAVAIDAYALDLVNELRAREKGRGPVDAGLTGWLDNAAAMGIGARTYTLARLGT